jgi:putative sigma-54 modulation protein
MYFQEHPERLRVARVLIENGLSVRNGRIYLNEIEETRVDLSYVKTARSASDRQVAEITARGKGFILRSEERSDDIFAAFDTAIDKMQRRMERYKGKHYRGRGNGRLAPVAESIPAEKVSGEHIGVISRRKTFDLIPMSEADALEQMKSNSESRRDQ